MKLSKLISRRRLAKPQKGLFTPLGTASTSKVWNFASALYSGGASAADYSNVNSSGKYVKDQVAGVYMLRQVAANALPIGTGVGLIPEPAATTLNQQSNALTNGYWVKIRSTPADNQTAGPDGAASDAGSLTEDSTASSTHFLSRNPTTISAATAYTYTWFGKRKDFDWVQLAVSDGTTFFWANFNLNTGAIGNKQASVTAIIEPSFVNGFYRLSITFTSGGAATAANHNVYMSRFTGNSASLAPSYSGDGVSGVYLFGGMLYASSFPLSHWPTTTTSLPRSSDVVTRTTGADLSAAAGQVTISAHTALGIGAANQVLWQRDDGTANNRFTIYRRASDRFIVFEVVSGGITQSSRPIWAVADDTDLTATIAWSGTTMQYTLSGMIVPFIEYNVIMPVGVTTERLGCNTTGAQWSGAIKSVAFSAAPSLPSYLLAASNNHGTTVAGTVPQLDVGTAGTLYGAGSDPLPAATNGYITGGAYTADQNNTCYAGYSVAQSPKTIVQQVSWVASNGATGNSNPAILISNVALGNIANCVHLQNTRLTINIQVRTGGSTFATLVSQALSLKMDGTLYQIVTTISTTTIANDTVTRRIVGPGVDFTITATDPSIATWFGQQVYFEQINSDAVDSAKEQFFSVA